MIPISLAIEVKHPQSSLTCIESSKYVALGSLSVLGCIQNIFYEPSRYRDHTVDVPHNQVSGCNEHVTDQDRLI
ncbi:hypothetical protein AWV79_26800 [Cupriavidus sp. UYMMa02A]|nr:hypothetical protein AWV79_26800 [Cupriavidus sp. UYMMa02A]